MITSKSSPALSCARLPGTHTPGSGRPAALRQLLGRAGAGPQPRPYFPRRISGAGQGEAWQKIASSSVLLLPIYFTLTSDPLATSITQILGPKELLSGVCGRAGSNPVTLLKSFQTPKMKDGHRPRLLASSPPAAPRLACPPSTVPSPLARAPTSQAGGRAGGEAGVLPGVGPRAVLLGDAAVGLAGHGAPGTGLEQAEPLGGRPGTPTLVLGKLDLGPREGQEHAAPQGSHLHTRAAGGAAGRPGLGDEPGEPGQRGEQQLQPRERRLLLVNTLIFSYWGLDPGPLH